ncbi:hypothetical protein TR51_27320 [Kitasatospora griseola]|uniref:Uncharacterized protein n=1 Tax=Kitasatospora griseola TaxID=2064 RepID=A0A0D0NU55_KITGR|nr:hypothetical protein [Kitasatospora griseola]KIQ62681.1 hypothetical protein TR51_27320 [Kitasatospora griseola]
MARKPSLPEIAALIAHLRANGNAGPSLAENAELLERIAANNPDDREAAQLARDARRAADKSRGNG